MSTSTTNLGLLKPEFSEASGPDDVAENMIKVERALINTWVGSATGRDHKATMARYRNASIGPINLNTLGAFDDLTSDANGAWASTTGSSAWTSLYDLDGKYAAPSLGLVFIYSTGSTAIYREGYYRITWNARVQMSNTTMSEGFVRATLWGFDRSSTYFLDYGVKGSSVVVAMNTMTNITDIGAEQIIKVTQRDRPQEVGNQITEGNNVYPHWDNTIDYRVFSIGIAQNNTSSATATVLLDETYIIVEFVRGL